MVGPTRMELDRTLFFKIKDMNCEFRTLHNMDVNQDYVSGLKEQNEYIENIPTKLNISTQKIYINNILSNKNATICGLFINNKLVGTAGVQSSTKFLQNIQVPSKLVSTIGILVINKNFIGMGMGKTLVWATTFLLHDSTGAVWFGAGMAKENIPSLKSFLSCGFRKEFEDQQNYKVLLNHQNLIKPEFIYGVDLK